jgi:hypothetical protein
MTLPDERYRAVLWAERFLKELATDRKKYPRIPTAVRQEAFSILRHYPNTWDMDRASDGTPDVFQPRMEPLTRLVMQYEQEQKDA